jgi:anaerobic selenocysteine-containing dehydrogenase
MLEPEAMVERVTYCRICEAACGLIAEVDAERLVSLRPDPEHVVSRGYACAKGTRFDQVHRSPERLDWPLRREGAELTRSAWPEALAEIGARLRGVRRQHGPHSVGVYMGNPSAFGFALPLMTVGFVRALGTRNFFSAGSLDCNNKFVVAKAMLGSSMTHPVPDFDRASFALLVGTNPAVSQSSFVHAPRIIERLAGIVRRGGRVVTVDPRRSETAKSVGEWLPIRPDTDAAFLLALLHVVFADGLERRDVIARHGAGDGALRRAVQRFSPERVAPFTGVEAAKIRELAHAFAAADGAFCHVSTGVNQGTFGNIAYAAKIALELVTGNLDRAGGALVPKGALDTATLARRFGFDREPAWKSRIGGFSPVMGALPTAILADEILEPGDEQIRALVVIAGNPILSAPDGERLRKAFSALELLVVIDLYVNDTAAHASHALPATDFLEREDFPLAMLQLQPEPYLQWTDAVVPPRGERKPEWWILSELARAAKLPLFGSRALDLGLRAALRLRGPRALVEPMLIPALGLGPLAKLRAHPHGLLVDGERPGDFLERRIGTPSKRVELYPEAVHARLDELALRVSSGGPPRNSPGPSQELRLFTKREKNGHNSWMHGNPRLALARHAAYLHPDDAERLGVAAGEQVRLQSAAGAIELPVAITRDVSPGTVAVPHGYGHDAGSGWKTAVARGGQNVNQLAPSGPAALDPLSGMCQFVGVTVAVMRVAARAMSAAE